MTNEALIIETLQKMNARLDAIDTRLDAIDTRLDAIEADLDEVRTGTNCLIAWADKCSHAIRLPLPTL